MSVFIDGPPGLGMPTAQVIRVLSAVFHRSDLRRLGSSAIVMPKETAEESLASDGPEVVLSIARWFDSGAEVQDSVTQALMRSVPVKEVDVFA